MSNREIIFNLIKDFYKEIENGENVYFSYIVNGTHLLLTTNDINFFDLNSVDDSVIESQLRFKTNRDMNFFRLFLLRMASDKYFKFGYFGDIESVRFHSIFYSFFERYRNRLSPSQMVVGYLDCFHPSPEKRRFLSNSMNQFILELKSKWVKADWFSSEHKTDKLNALIYYAKNLLNLELASFDIEGVNIFFDTLCASNTKEHVSFHFGKIRSLFNNRQHRNKTEKLQVNLQISRKSNNEIDNLAKKYGLNRSEVVDFIFANIRKSGAEGLIFSKAESHEVNPKILAKGKHNSPSWTPEAAQQLADLQEFPEARTVARVRFLLQ